MLVSLSGPQRTRIPFLIRVSPFMQNKANPITTGTTLMSTAIFFWFFDFLIE